jgi:hypothetical protein
MFSAVMEAQKGLLFPSFQQMLSSKLHLTVATGIKHLFFTLLDVFIILGEPRQNSVRERAATCNCQIAEFMLHTKISSQLQIYYYY